MLNPDFSDILSDFAREGVEFLVVGAYALAAHGLPRATGDIDLWVRPELPNAKRVYRALIAFGAPMTALSPVDFTQEGIVFQIGVAPNRIDILTSISGVAFNEAWDTREEVDLEGLSIPVISRDLLIRNKRATGREKDELDAKWLEDQGTV